MKVLGIDIGIANCGYCIVEHDPESDHFNIPGDCKKNWNIINLIEDHKKHCENPECDNTVTKTCIINKTDYYFCGRHKKFHKDLLEKYPLDFVETDDPTIKCGHSASCKSKSKFIFNQTHLCTTHQKMWDRNLTKERELRKYKMFVRDFTVHDLKLSLLRKLDELQDILLFVDVVCIEMQPALKAPKMKMIADTLYCAFLMRGIIDREYTGSTIEQIVFFAPSNKMKINGQEEELNEEIDNAKNKYKKTKELGIRQCVKMLNHDQSCIDHLNTFKKKDDLCDAYLHSCYYIQKEMGLKKNKKKTKKAVTQDTDTLENTINA
jgi:hypothetical protein